jgi:hypothetical protein
MANKDQLETEESPRWLKKLQLNSWEPEILLSGIVLYGMFKTPELLDQLYLFVQANLSDGVNDLNNFISLLKVAIYWLIFGLILHLISRGIWVGVVGLSFTFPKGIDHNNLKLSPKFKKRMELIPSMHRIIISLEKICSSLFSVSFMLFMCMVGGYFYFLVMLIVPLFSFVYFFNDGSFGDINHPIAIAYIISIVVLGLFALFDFLTLGWVKRFKWFSRLYYPIYRFIGFITLASLYRPIYYSIISNLSKWKISLFLFLFVFTSLYALNNTDFDNRGENFSQIELWSERANVTAFTGHYDDQNADHFSMQAHIQSDIIRGNTLRLFVVLRADNEKSIRKNCNYDSLIQAADTARAIVDLQCLETYYRVSINDSILQDIPWKFHYKSSTKQRGILTWINIRNLSEGIHELKLDGAGESRFRNFATIPFYREYPDGSFLPAYSAPKNEKKDADFMEIKPLLPK